MPTQRGSLGSENFWEAEGDRAAQSERYDKLHKEFMDLQRLLAMYIDQTPDKNIWVYDDPGFPRLAYTVAERRGQATRIFVIRVPDAG